MPSLKSCGIHVCVMPVLCAHRKKKTEPAGVFTHDTYTVTIPSETAGQARLHDDMTLYAVLRGRTITLHAEPPASSGYVPVTVRTKRTRTYKTQSYYTTRVTIPVEYIRALGAGRGDKIEAGIKAGRVTLQVPAS